MLTKPQIHLASIFIKIFYRDRQSLFFSLLFPLIFTCIFLFSGGEPRPTKLGLVNQSQDELSLKFIDLVKQEKAFIVKEGSESELKEDLIAADQTAVIIIPDSFNQFPNPGKLRLLLDASQVRQVDAIKDSLEATLLSIERDIRNIEPCLLYTSDAADE